MSQGLHNDPNAHNGWSFQISEKWDKLNQALGIYIRSKKQNINFPANYFPLYFMEWYAALMCVQEREKKVGQINSLSFMEWFAALMSVREKWDKLISSLFMEWYAALLHLRQEKKKQSKQANTPVRRCK